MLRGANRLENWVDRTRQRRFRRLDPTAVEIMPFIGYGTHTHLILQGRVLRPVVKAASHTDSMSRNLFNTLRRFNSKEIPFATVEASYNGQTLTVQADDDGFFEVRFPFIPAPDRPHQVVHEILLTLMDYPYRTKAVSMFPSKGQVLVPPPDTQFGVISDIDDTIVQTDVLSLMRMIRNTFLRNAHTRVPFDGVAAFYQALQRGTNAGFNPIFYVSNSPWNLYDVLVDFLELKHIPLGPFFLRNIGLGDRQFFARPGQAHKFAQIEHIFNLYPDLSFILIGDSGEHDAEIYLRILKQYRQQVLAIYIRDVVRFYRDRKLTEFTAEAGRLGVEMLLVKDTVAAAHHAIQRGFIPAETLPGIRTERDSDKKG